MIQHIAFACQIVIGVVGHVHGGGCVGICLVSEGQHIVIRQANNHAYLQIAGEAFLTIGRQAGECQSAFHFLHIEEALIKALGAAVELVLALTGYQIVGLAVQREGGVADAVAHTADACAEEAAVLLIFQSGIVAKGDVHQFAITIRDQKGLQGAAIVKNHSFTACIVADAICRYLTAIGKSAKGKLIHIFSFHRQFKHAAGIMFSKRSHSEGSEGS